MYYREDEDQLTLEEFYLPFGGRLRKDNRWVRLAESMPWGQIEEVYARNMSEETGRPGISSRIAFGSLYIKTHCHLTDEGTVMELQENPYMQYFVGMHEFHPEPLFDSSMMVHFRKRFPVEEVAKINEYVCTGKWPEEQRNVDRNDEEDKRNEPPAPPSVDGEGTPGPSRQKGKKNTSKKKEKRRKKNRGKLLLDATVAPADIKYPTDIDLLNKSREHLETAVNILWEHVPHSSHKLPYSAKKAKKSYLKLAKSKKWTQAKCRKAIGAQLRYIELATRQLEKYSSLVPDANTLFPRWLRDRLVVIPVVYQQQKEMYDNRTHKCENRIVSLEQPHVRPIQRGKRPNPTEFGQKLHLSVVDGFTYLEQTSWSNFNEGCDLEAAVEDYLRKFGCYPTAVLADKIYQTRSNKLYCKVRGIRLSGLPLGRRKASETDVKIRHRMYLDSCERNAIEGRNGNAKRRFGLDCIFSKLDETAKTEAAFIILALNASHQLARSLALFFRFLFFRLEFWLFQQTLL
ncbi:MAG: IS5 family transposase [Oscillospiraceae bacterium]|nr:IS5 family transposase [Oscillospiraceae bacterium]